MKFASRRNAIMREKRQKSHGARSIWHGRYGKTVTCALQVPLGQRQSDVQGRCRLARTNPSYSKTQDAYDKLNRVNNQGSPCSGFCLQLHLLGWIPCEQFHLDQKSVQASPCLLTCLVAVFFCRGDIAVFHVADSRFSYWSYRKDVSSPVMIRLRNVGSSSALLIRSSCDLHVDLASECVTRCAG